MPVFPVDLSQVDGAGGVVWSLSPEGFHTNLVVLGPHGSMGAHVNDALDVLVVVLAGAGSAVVDEQTVDLAAMTAVLFPRGATRSITAGPGGLRYLTVHARREPITTIGRQGRHSGNRTSAPGGRPPP